MIPTLYGILMLVIWAFLNAHGVMYMAVIATLFGGTAVAFATALGGANLTPAMLGQGFVGLNILRREGLKGFLNQITFGSPSFWLMLLTMWALFSAFALPRFFEGQFAVSTFDRDGAGDAIAAIQPVSMNITQSMYAFLAFMTFIMTRTVLAREGALQVLTKAVLWVAGLNALMALYEFAQYFLGAPAILAAFKNANYNMMGGEVAGLMRVTGTFPEASMFSQYTVAIVAFTHSLWLRGIYRNWAKWLTIVNLGFLLVSTSGTAYVSLAACMLFALTYTLWRLLRHGSAGVNVIYLQFTGVGILAAAAVVLFVPAALTAVIDFFDVVIGSKLASQSGTTRLGMNALAFQNFVDSYGLGAGLGSARASSFIMVLLSNLGWMGCVLFGCFAWLILFGPLRTAAVSDEQRAIALAARHAVFATLVSVSLIGLVYDLGFMFYIFAAMACLPAPHAQPAIRSSQTPGRQPS
jgi:hypothetical protein